MKSITASFYRGAVGALILYDITNEKSFNEAKKYLSELKEYATNDIVVMLVGNKCDLEDQRVVKAEDATKFAE